MESLILPIVFGIGLVAGFINVIVGSGSSIMVPALLFLGFPPHVAIATNRFAMLFNNGTGAIRYYQKKYLDLKTAAIFSISAAVGAVIGALTVLSVNSDIIKIIVAVILIAEAVILVFGAKNLGIEGVVFELTKKNLIIGLIIGLLVGLYGGFIGMAMTSLLIFLFISMFRMRFIESAAMAKVLTFTISFFASIVFIVNFKVDFTVAAVLIASYIIGAWLGVNSAIKMGDKRIRIFFIVIVLASAIKLLFF